MVALDGNRWQYHRYDDDRDAAAPSANSSGHIEPNEDTSLISESYEEQRRLDNQSSDEPQDTESVCEATLSTGRVILLCLGMLGLQLAWAAEMSNGSPFLLSLGMSKSLLAIVWMAGPLAGVLVQPIAGVWSDSCQISWGRRRPFLVAGSICTVISLLCLAWTPDIVRSIANLFGVPPESHSSIIGAQIFAVFWIYMLDIGVNLCMSLSYLSSALSNQSHSTSGTTCLYRRYSASSPTGPG